MHKPKQVDGFFVWQCAYPDACGNYVLHGNIWDMLSGWDKKDGCSLFKYYRTEEEAYVALRKAVIRIRDCINTSYSEYI